MFNHDISCIASDLQGKIHYNLHDFSKYLTNSNEFSFFINPTNKYEIISIINTIKNFKANDLTVSQQIIFISLN